MNLQMVHICNIGHRPCYSLDTDAISCGTGRPPAAPGVGVNTHARARHIGAGDIRATADLDGMAPREHKCHGMVNEEWIMD